jgi:DNA adenine methylase
MKFYSPLRYPGGKNRLSKFIEKICLDNNIGHYIEPYAGGASVALYLLLEGRAKKITINDYDRSIYAFWYCVLNRTEEFCKLIKDIDINLENWDFLLFFLTVQIFLE